jgi:hypothetical protein
MSRDNEMRNARSGKGVKLFGKWPLVALLAAAVPQTILAQSSDEIIVEGSRDREKKIEAFVRALTPARIGGQLARFDDEVCPAAAGLPAHQNEAIVERMRAVAKAAGIAVASGKCEPNAIVFVVDDKKAFMAALRDKYPAYFSTALSDRMPMPREDGPAVAWHVESILDENGLKPPIVRNPETGAEFFAVSSMSSGRVKPMSRPHFVAGILVIEVRALAGLTPTQLADYAAMRIYGRTEPKRVSKGSASSILSIIDAPMDSAVPITMTEWDLTFLKALYRSEPLQKATQQRADIGREFRRELDSRKAVRR